VPSVRVAPVQASDATVRVSGSMVMRRAKKRKNLSSAPHYDQIRFRFHATKTLNRHKQEYFAAVHSAHDVLDCGPFPRNRPGGNATGISNINVELMPKRLELLHELLPRAVRFGVLVNPDSPMAESIFTEVRVAAAAIDRQIELFTARSNREIDTAFANLVQKGIDALLVGPDALTDNRRVQLAMLAMLTKIRLPPCRSP
jgi:ABC-type uncharacterized transport system substrate-binding protein